MIRIVSWLKYRDTYRIVISGTVPPIMQSIIDRFGRTEDRLWKSSRFQTANVTVLFARQAATDDALSDRHPGSRLEQRPQDVTRVRVLHVESELSTEERAQLAQHLDQAPLACDRRSVHLNKLSRGSYKKAFFKRTKVTRSPVNVLFQSWHPALLKTWAKQEN